MSLILRNLFAPPVLPPSERLFTTRCGAQPSPPPAQHSNLSILQPAVAFSTRYEPSSGVAGSRWYDVVAANSGACMCPIFVQEISCSKSEVFIIEITKGCFRRFVATFWSTFIINVRRARVKQFSYLVGGDLLEVNVGWDELRLVHRASGDGTCFPILVEVCELFLSVQSFNNIWRLN